MNLAVEDYLDRVMRYANRKPSDAREIRREHESHLEQKIEALLEQGRCEADAVHIALRDHGDAKVVGYRLRERFPLLDVRTTGTARGVIAVGPRAVGILAIGGTSIGIFSFGGLSIGVFGIGGICLSLLFAWAGAALVPFGAAYAGLAVGLVAVGGIACGWYAAGALAYSVVPAADFPRWLVELLSSRSVYLYLSAILGILFIGFWGLSSRLIRRERARVREHAELVGW